MRPASFFSPLSRCAGAPARSAAESGGPSAPRRAPSAVAPRIALRIAIDDARDADMAAIADLYNHEVRFGVALWNVSPRSAAAMAAWAADRRAAGYAVLSARAGAVWLGYGATGPFRPQDGFAGVVENSIYVAAAARGLGVGARLLAALEERSAARGAHAMIGALDSAAEASRRLHRRAGFQEVGRLPDVGRKFDQPRTLVLMQKTLERSAP